MDQPTLADVDPFDLPEWLGTSQVVWQADAGLRTGHLVHGRLTGDGPDLPCDLMAVDEAFPVPVADATTRTAAHQAWRHGQVLLGDLGGRLTLVVPGTRLAPDLVLDVLSRLARAVGADPERYAVMLRIGAERRGRQG